MKNFIEVIKTNKKAIMKRALVVGGTLAGLAIVAKMVQPKTDEIVVEGFEVVEENDTETSDGI